MLPSFFDSVLRPHRQDLDRSAARRARGDEHGAMTAEPGGTRSAQALTIIAQNIDLAADGEGAICQDTGMPTFEVKTPVGANQIWMRQQIREAVAEATRRGKLRPELGRLDHRRELRRQPRARARRSSTSSSGSSDEIEVKLILKGGGCENMNAQYSLPVELPHLGRADRTLEGVRKCILHAVWQAQGKGCAPGRGRRVHRRRSHVRLPAREGAAVPHARRRESRIRGSRSSKPTIMGDGEHARHRHDGVRRQRCRSSAARSARSTGCRRASSCRSPTTAGRSAASACVLDARDRRDHAAGSIAIPSNPIDPDARSGRLRAHRPRGRARRRRSTRRRCAR